MAQGSRPADAGITIGQVFLGKYRVDSILGHGGMGVVAECTHLALNERVAVKMLREDVLLDHDAVQRFVREAQAAVKLKSEYVARVSDVGTFENGTPYMVMEFLEGHDLGALLKQRGALPVAWASELILQTAEALAEAHSLGIVHRDVKPTNLFVTWRPDGSALIKVLDFGISKAPMGTDMQLTQTQSLLGTPAYMSPEQMRSARLVDSRSDIWSLGTVFYEILEGRRPFEADSFSEMCVKVAVDPPAPMVNTPPQLQPVIMRCLAKTPEQRYPSMADLARDLIPFVADPHSATVLVERMARMLRRGHVEWESTTGVSRVPQSVRDVGSAPVRSQWSSGTDPSGRAWQGGSDPAMAPYRGRAASPRPEESRPGFAPPTTVSFKPRSRWPLVLTIIGVLTMTGLGLGLYASSLGETPQETPKAHEPTVDPNAGATTPSNASGSNATAPATETKADTKVDPKVDTKVDPKVDTKVDPSVDTNPTKQAEGSAAKNGSGDPKAIDVKADDTKDGKHGTKHPGSTTKTTKTTNVVKTTAAGTGTGKKPDDTKTTKVPPPLMDPNAAPKDQPKDQPKCDPFGAMHGCAK